LASIIFIAHDEPEADIDEVRTIRAPVAAVGKIEGKAFAFINRNSSRKIAIGLTPIPRKAY
jgi:hypothetical protein